MSILNATLKDFKYYKNKLPLYLQQSHGFLQHYRIWFDLMTGSSDYTGVIPSADTLLELLNIFDDDYIDKLLELEDSGVGTAIQDTNGEDILDTDGEEIFDTDSSLYGRNSDILDKIGLLFGVKRQFSVAYSKDSEIVTRELNLDNKDFLLLIKSQIVKNYFDGSYRQIKEYYDSVGLKLFVITNSAATSYLYLLKTSGYEDYSEDVEAMFLSGLLRIESMGIDYYQTILDLENSVFWDSVIATQTWDNGAWLI